MKLKFENKMPYVLDIGFDNPLWEFGKTPENKIIISEIIDERTKPSIYRGNILETKSALIDLANSYLYNLPHSDEGGNICISGLQILIDTIRHVLAIKMPSLEIDIDIIPRLLMGGMEQEYYSTGKYGEDFFKELDIENASIESGKYDFKYGKPLSRNILDYAVPFCLEYDSSQYIMYYKRMCELYKYGSNIGRNYKDLPSLIVNSIESMHNLGVASEPILTFDQKALDHIRLLFPDFPILLKGIRQVRIKRKTIYSPYALLSSIIACVYAKKEIFLVFDPYYWRIGFYDREHISIGSDNPQIVINFQHILNEIFSGLSMTKTFTDYSHIFSGKKTKPEKIKEMFDELLSTLNDLSPDDVTLIAEGKSHDNNRFLEISEKIPYGDVGFTKHNGKKTGVRFSIKKKLKNKNKKIR